jgi:hypothetical protein
MGESLMQAPSDTPPTPRILVSWSSGPGTQPRPDRGAGRAAYLPEPWAPAGQLLGLDAGGLLSHAVADAPMADGRAVAMNLDAMAGVLGPQTGPYQERFRQRAAVCDYKAADLASVADQLERLPAEAAGLLGGRLDLDRLGAFGHSFGGNAALQ